VSRIFVNYRREDTPAHAGRLYDWLRDRYGETQVFMDVDSISHGDDFVAAIERVVRSADVMLVVIGEKWLTVADEHGSRRLDDPEDFIRIEIEAALTSNIRVVPILVGGAEMPSSEDLPGSLAMLNRRQAFELSDLGWQSSLDALGRNLDIIMGTKSGEDDGGHGRASAPSESWLQALAGKLRVGRRR
jgi:hypothetical protein